MIDLKPFCAADDDLRHYLQRPWKNEDGRIMASNGHIAVLLNNGEDVPDVLIGRAQLSEKIMEWARSVPADDLFIPAPSQFDQDPECTHCDGNPAEPDEDGDVMECYWCEGTGFNKKEAVRVGNAAFAKHYLRLLASLPECEIAPRGAAEKAYFRFKGGVGFLMPVRT